MADSIATLLGWKAMSRTARDFMFPALRMSSFFDVARVRDNIEGVLANWDVMIADRALGTHTGHGAPANEVNLVPMRKDTAVLLRKHESRNLAAITLNQLRQPGGTTKQNQGRAEVTRQQESLVRRNRQMMEQHLALTFTPGDQTYTFTDGRGTEVTQVINNAIPAENHNEAGGTLGITGGWATPTNDILGDLDIIVEAVQASSGMEVAHAWCNQKVRGYFQKNNTIVNLLGGTNAAVNALRTRNDVEINGIMFHFYNNTYKDAAGAVQKFIPDDKVIFHPELNAEWFKMFHGTELVSADGRNLFTARGLSSWGYIDRNPTAVKVFVTDNYLSVLTIPGAVAYASVS